MLSVRLPFGAFVWNHPVSIIVERGAVRETMPVPDITLMTGIFLTLGVLLIPLMFLLSSKGVKK